MVQLSDEIIQKVLDLKYPLHIDDASLEFPHRWLCDEGAYTESRKAGTSATEKSDTDGIFAKPVFYDWAANWPQVRELFKHEDTQRVLHYTIAHTRGEQEWRESGGSHSHWMEEYSRTKKFPYLHLQHTRLRDGQQEAAIRNDLTLQEWNEKLKNHIYTYLRKVLGKELRCLDTTQFYMLLDEELSCLDEESSISSEQLEDFLMKQLHDSNASCLFDLCEVIESEEFPFLYDVLNEWYESTLDGALLLLGVHLGWTFGPYLTYKLAWELSPPTAKLRIIGDPDGEFEASHCVVFDYIHNVVYDLAYYFLDSKDAVSALAAARGTMPDPQLESLELTQYHWLVDDSGGLFNYHKLEWEKLMLDTCMYAYLRLRHHLPLPVLSMVRGYLLSPLDACHICGVCFEDDEKEDQLWSALALEPCHADIRKAMFIRE